MRNARADRGPVLAKHATIASLLLLFAWQGCFDNEAVHGNDEGDDGAGALGGTRSGSGGKAGAGSGGSGTSGAAGSDGGAGDPGGSGGNGGVGIVVEPTSGLRTSEEGAEATFTVRLSSRPTSDVSIRVSSDDTSEGTVAQATLTFTTANFSAPQIVTVTGIDDTATDGTVTYNVVTEPAASSDADYDGLDADDVELENIDDETPGITVDAAPDLQTSESGGQATFTVRLNSQPSADVTLALEVSDATEGTVAPSELVFSPESWRAPQLVTVTGLDDSLEDGPQDYLVTGAAASSDAGYSALDMPDVPITNVDNDIAGVTIGMVSSDTTEEGGQATFTVVLNAEPAAEVSIALSSSDTGEGTVSPSGLRFTTANWNAPQTVTATGVDDEAVDGRQPFIAVTGDAASSDAKYSGLNVPDVQLYNRDDDSPDVIVSAPSGSTTEWGGQATFTIRLQSEPTANVSIALSSSDTGEGRVSPASVTFTPQDWNDVQTVTVTGQDDAIEDGTQPYSIVTGAATSSDAAYSNRVVPDVQMANVDNDDAGVTLVSTDTGTTEGGGQGFFTIRLNSQPTANVSIGLTSSDTGEGTVLPPSLTFTDQNWDTPQTVTVTGVDDALVDGSQPYTIVTGNTTSSDARYSGLVVPDVAMTNLDNDVEDPLDVMAGFDGAGLLVPCATNPPPRDARNCYNYVSGTSCPGNGTVRTEQFTVGGNPAMTYEAVLRVRGVSELKMYTGGTRRSPTGTIDAWYIGGTPSTATPPYNLSRITISDPPQTYYFNSGPDASYSRHEVFELDYQVTIQARGGATVQLTNSDPNCEIIKNCGAPLSPQTQCVPITLAGLGEPRITAQPYNGQFVMLDLLQATLL